MPLFLIRVLDEVSKATRGCDINPWYYSWPLKSGIVLQWEKSKKAF